MHSVCACNEGKLASVGAIGALNEMDMGLEWIYRRRAPHAIMMSWRQIWSHYASIGTCQLSDLVVRLGMMIATSFTLAFDTWFDKLASKSISWIGALLIVLIAPRSLCIVNSAFAHSSVRQNKHRILISSSIREQINDNIDQIVLCTYTNPAYTTDSKLPNVLILTRSFRADPIHSNYTRNMYTVGPITLY